MSTKYNRWQPEERKYIFQNLDYGLSYYFSHLSSFPKVDNNVSSNILKKINKLKPIQFLQTKTNPDFYVHRIPYNYVKAFNFVPYFWNEIDGQKKSEDYKPYKIVLDKYANAFLAILNSNLFFWWWYCLFEGYHCGKHEIYNFPIGIEKMLTENLIQLEELSRKLMAEFMSNKNRKECNYKNTGKVIYDEFFPKKSKPLIDKIDNILAKHYNFTQEELDFIINYDIKYRMGKELNQHA